VLRALHVTARMGRDTATGAIMVDGTFEFAGPLPHWDIGFGTADAEELAEFKAELTDPKVVEALAALTERLQVHRSSLLLSL
jgi:hypothetical protein